MPGFLEDFEHTSDPPGSAGTSTSTPEDLAVLRVLEHAVAGFVEAERTLDPASARAYWAVTRVLGALLDAIAQARAAGCGSAAIHELVAPAREICASAPLIGHAQTWPRGYPGDFEIVEQIMTHDNRAVPGTFGFHLEHFMLSSAAAQQHRNKVAHQARLISQALTSRSSHGVRVLLIASGAAADLRSVHPQLVGADDHFVLNDIDHGALALAERLLQPIATQCTFIEGNIFKQIGRLTQLGPFDLVLAGGLFDYLDDASATSLVESALTDLVAPGGLLYFSNISAGQPYGIMLEHLLCWELIERDEAPVRALVRRADVDVTVRRDLTTITLLAEVRKHG